MLRYISYWFAMRLAIIPSLRRRSIERSLSFRHGVARVVIRIVFVVRAVVGYALNNDFGIVAAGEGALRISPIVLGLALVVVGHQPLAFLVLAKVSRRFGRVFVNREVTERVDGIAFLPRLDDKFLGEFMVTKSR